MNSLSKFYHALDTEADTASKGTTDITISNLVDMAKKVSDKMILSKAEVSQM